MESSFRQGYDILISQSPTLSDFDRVGPLAKAVDRCVMTFSCDEPCEAFKEFPILPTLSSLLNTTDDARAAARIINLLTNSCLGEEAAALVVESGIPWDYKRWFSAAPIASLSAGIVSPDTGASPAGGAPSAGSDGNRVETSRATKDEVMTNFCRLWSNILETVPECNARFVDSGAFDAYLGRFSSRFSPEVIAAAAASAPTDEDLASATFNEYDSFYCKASALDEEHETLSSSLRNIMGSVELPPAAVASAVTTATRVLSPYICATKSLEAGEEVGRVGPGEMAVGTLMWIIVEAIAKEDVDYFMSPTPTRIPHRDTSLASATGGLPLMAALASSLLQNGVPSSTYLPAMIMLNYCCGIDPARYASTEEQPREEDPFADPAMLLARVKALPLNADAGRERLVNATFSFLASFINRSASDTPRVVDAIVDADVLGPACSSLRARLQGRVGVASDVTSWLPSAFHLVSALLAAVAGTDQETKVRSYLCESGLLWFCGYAAKRAHLLFKGNVDAAAQALAAAVASAAESDSRAGAPTALVVSIDAERIPVPGPLTQQILAAAVEDWSGIDADRAESGATWLLSDIPAAPAAAFRKVLLEAIGADAALLISVEAKKVQLAKEKERVE